MSYSKVVLKSNPVAYHPMDNSALPLTNVAGTGSAYDIATRGWGTNYLWTYRNFPMTAGSDGCFRAFAQGVNHSVPNTTPLTDPEAPFSHEFWMFLDKADLHTGGAIDMEYGYYQITGQGFYIKSGILFFGIGYQEGGFLGDSERLEPNWAVSWAVPDWNQAYHIVGVYTGTGLALYVNGQVVASSQVGVFRRRHGNATHRLQTPAGANASLFIEHNAIYNRPLGADEIMSHYLAGVDYFDYETEFTNNGAEVIVIDDRDNVPLYSKRFEADDWARFESSRNVSLGPTGVTLQTRTPAEPHLLGEKPYENIVPLADSEFPYYTTGAWQTDASAQINGDGVGLPEEGNYQGGQYSFMIRKITATGAMRAYRSTPVTAGQTYRVVAHANSQRAHRLSVIWKNSGGTQIGSTEYGTSTAFTGDITSANLHTHPFRAPATAVTAEFGVETTAADALVGEILWLDNFKVFRDLQYSTTSEDGVFVYGNQSINVKSASAFLSQAYSAVQGNFYIDTAVHNDSLGHTMWELYSPDGKTVFSLNINTANTLELRFRYYDEVALAYTSVSVAGPTVTTMGTGWRSLYVVITEDAATLYYGSVGTSYALNPGAITAPMSVGDGWNLVVGNNADRTSPWNSKLKYINLRPTPESTLTFTDAVGDYTLRLSKTANAPLGGLEVSQAGFVVYKVPVNNGTIAGSRITFTPGIIGTTGTTTTAGANLLVRTSTDGSTWSSRLYSNDIIPSYGGGVVTSNSFIWVRIDLSSERSDFYPAFLDSLKLDLWETLVVKGNYNSLALNVMGTAPKFGDRTLHPSSHYKFNGFSTGGTAALYMGSQAISSLASIDASGTIPAANKAYRTIGMMVYLDGVDTNDYLFYHDEAGVIYSLYWNGTGYQYTGFSAVYIYTSNELRGAMTNGYVLPQWQWCYIVMVAPVNLVPLDGDLTRFNFMTRSAVNIANTTGGTLNFVSLYPTALTAQQAADSFDTLRSIRKISLTDNASAVVTEPVVPSAVTGDWGYIPLTAQE